MTPCQGSVIPICSRQTGGQQFHPPLCLTWIAVTGSADISPLAEFTPSLGPVPQLAVPAWLGQSPQLAAQSPTRNVLQIC